MFLRTLDMIKNITVTLHAMKRTRRIFFCFSLVYIMSMLTPEIYAQPLSYLPLGDSYTICEGLPEAERWPNLITQQMNTSSTRLKLVGNPARTGYTTDDLVRIELPVLKQQTVQVATILIGVNDYVRGYDTAHFHKNLVYIIDEVQKVLADPLAIVLITIPDYSVTPGGAMYAKGRDVSADLRIWNTIIEQEALKRNLGFADIYPVSLGMKNSPALVGADGLHPSAKEVALWAEIIFPEMEKLVKKQVKK